jgi:hypothetical protein
MLKWKVISGREKPERVEVWGLARIRSLKGEWRLGDGEWDSHPFQTPLNHAKDEDPLTANQSYSPRPPKSRTFSRPVNADPTVSCKSFQFSSPRALPLYRECFFHDNEHTSFSRSDVLHGGCAKPTRT